MITDRHGPSHKAGVPRGRGQHGMMDSVVSQEPGILKFDPPLLLTAYMISHTSLDLSYKIWEMHIRKMGLIQ